MGLTQIGNKKSLSERAYEVIKEAIITGDFKQGQILTEEQLAAELGISRTPVRSAVKQLEFEHLLEVTSSKNIVVMSISDKDIYDASKARQLVEVEAAGILAETVTLKQLKQLERNIELQKKALSEKNYLDFLEYEYQFHAQIGEFCGNIWYETLLKNIGTLQRRVVILTGHLEKDWSYAIEEHLQIVTELKNHNKKAARESMKKHLDNVEARLI